MLFSFISLALAASFLGGIAKYADLLNEHGVTPQFNEPPILSGLLWGISGIAIMLISPVAGLTYVAHVLYWFLRVKLEYPNHAIAGVMILLSSFLLQPYFYASHSLELFGVFLGYTITGYIHTYLKKNKPSCRAFLRLRFRIYFVPLIYSFYLWDFAPFISTCFGMLACEIVTHYFRDLSLIDLPDKF